MIHNIINLVIEKLDASISSVERLILKNIQDVDMLKREVKRIEAEIKDPIINSEITLFKDDLRFFSSMVKNRLSESITRKN